MEQNLQQLIQQYKEVYLAYEYQAQLIHIFIYSMFIIPPLVTLLILAYKDKLGKISNNIWFLINKRARIISIKKNAYQGALVGIVLGLVILTGLFSFGYYILQVQPKEHFPILLVLNSQGELGSYPTNLIPRENASVILLVKNYEGKPELFMIKVYLVNGSFNSTIGTYYNIVNYKGEWKQLILFSINNTGIYKIQFFLYNYDINSNTFRYTGIFTQLIVNVSF